MKFTKFIPLACACAFATTAALADPVNLHADYTVEVPNYFSITETSKTINATGVAIDTSAETGDITGIHWTNSMGASYHVVSNYPSKTFYIKATCPVTGTPKAFATTVTGETSTAVGTTLIAFANTDAATAPTQTHVDHAVDGSTDASLNPNVIGIAFTRGIVDQQVGTCSSIPMTNRELVYTITAGTYEVPFTLGTQAVANTFDSHDEAGTYQATITITDAPSS